MRFFQFRSLVICFTYFGFMAGCTQPEKASQPNIILIYTDDMGIGDASYTGGEVIATPNIDKLARAGKIFTQYYTTAPVCSPSRVGVMTGMYHIRWGINTFLHTTEFNQACEQRNYLESSAPTIAKVLQSAGYQTAHFGKWHMGGGRDVDDAPPITSYGFMEYASTWESPDPDPLITGGNWIWQPEDSIERWDRTGYFVDKTLDFIKRNSDKPFFVNLWPDDVHTPWIAADSSYENWRARTFDLPYLKPVMEAYDREIGRLIEELERLGEAENTLILFTSDNGPEPSDQRIRTNGLRGVKNSLYEGGINMPFFAYWPGVIAAGQVDSSAVLASVDLLPTLAQIAGAELPSGVTLDGEDFSDALLNNSNFKRSENLFFEYGRNENFRYPEGESRSPHLAVRKGSWKLLTNADGTDEELYNLSSDPNEANNLSEVHLDIAKEMKKELIEWYVTQDKAEL